MTNNPTIDGVSRELLERVAYRLSDLKQCELSETLFAILSNPFKCNFCDDKKSVCVDWDAGEWMSCPRCSPESGAPAVERQEPIKTPDMPYKMLPLEEDGWFQCVNAYEAMYPLYDGFAVARHSKRLIEQQESTIAQLQARVQELESGMGDLK